MALADDKGFSFFLYGRGERVFRLSSLLALVTLRCKREQHGLGSHMFCSHLHVSRLNSLTIMLRRSTEGLFY